MLNPGCHPGCRFWEEGVLSSDLVEVIIFNILGGVASLTTVRSGSRNCSRLYGQVAYFARASEDALDKEVTAP